MKTSKPKANKLFLQIGKLQADAGNLARDPYFSGDAAQAFRECATKLEEAWKILSERGVV